MHDNSGEGGREGEDKDPGDNENGEGTEGRASGPVRNPIDRIQLSVISVDFLSAIFQCRQE